MKALLIYPGEINYDFAEYFFPVGLLYIDKALEQIGVDATVWDLRVKRLEDVPRHDYAFVGFSLMTAGNMISRFLDAALSCSTTCRGVSCVGTGAYCCGNQKAISI